MFECVESQIDDMMKEMPDSLKIPSSHLTLATTSIGQGTILILNTEDIQYLQLLALGMSLNVLNCVLYNYISPNFRHFFKRYVIQSYVNSLNLIYCN